MQEIQKIIERTVTQLFHEDEEVELTRPDVQFGDFATNIALKLGKRLDKNPKEIAEAIIAKLPENVSIASAEVAGPGFINIRLSDGALLKLSEVEIIPTKEGQTCLIETNNPNPFKDIHIGHAFNSVVADTLAILLEKSGAKMVRVSYHGDVGLHVGKALWAIFDECGDKAYQAVKKLSDGEFPLKMREWYARGAGIYEEEPTVKSAIEELAKQSFSPSGEVKKVYELCRARSFDYFDQVFDRLGSLPVKKRFLESSTDDAAQRIVKANTPKVFEKSEGAIIFRGEKYGLHTRVFINHYGNTLYEARDLGLIELKNKYTAADESYIVTAEEQKEYFKVVLKAAELAMPKIKTKTINVSSGTVKLTTGKMSSRTGQVVTIEWLFEQIEAAIRKISKHKNSSKEVALGAIRYGMLKSRLDNDIIFDVEQSVSLEGNTGPYLQYAHARACSILNKAGKAKLATDFAGVIFSASERSLLLKLGEYPEVVGRAIEELRPHHICTYLFELAHEFNGFYENDRIIGSDREAIRLALVKMYTEKLAQGLGTLGIPAPEKM